MNYITVSRVLRVFILTMSLLSFLFMSLGLYMVFFTVPNDYLQGELVKIMYIHVPCAWLSTMLYSFMACSAGMYIIKKNPIFDIVAKTSAPVTIAVTLAAIVTGMIWGKPAWGAWWVWDARLTSILIMLLITIIYTILRDSLFQDERAASVSSIFAIVGLINLPIIKFSVDIWSTLHQRSSIIRVGGPTIHNSMLYPLAIMFIGMLFFSLLVIAINIKTELYRRRLNKYLII